MTIGDEAASSGDERVPGASLLGGSTVQLVRTLTWPRWYRSFVMGHMSHELKVGTNELS